MEARAYADDTICVYGYFEQERLACLITQSVEAPHNGTGIAATLLGTVPLTALEEALVSWGAVKVPAEFKVTTKKAERGWTGDLGKDSRGKTRIADDNACFFSGECCYGVADAGGNVIWVQVFGSGVSIDGLLSELSEVRQAISDYFRGEQ